MIEYSKLIEIERVLIPSISADIDGIASDRLLFIELFKIQSKDCSLMIRSLWQRICITINKIINTNEVDLPAFQIDNINFDMNKSIGLCADLDIMCFYNLNRYISMIAADYLKLETDYLKSVTEYLDSLPPDQAITKAKDHLHSIDKTELAQLAVNRPLTDWQTKVKEYIKKDIQIREEAALLANPQPKQMDENQNKSQKPFEDFLSYDDKDFLIQVCKEIFNSTQSEKSISIMFCILSTYGMIKIETRKRKFAYSGWYQLINKPLPRNDNFEAINKYINPLGKNGIRFKNEKDPDYINMKSSFDREMAKGN